MKKILIAAFPIFTLFLILFWSRSSPNPPISNPSDHREKGPTPNDYLFLQRAFPYDNVPSEAYYAAVEWAQERAVSRNNALEWELAGPTNVGGRITDVAMHHTDLQTVYAATASGGVWKSSDAGDSWFPITDVLPSLSIGDIAIDPSDQNTIYCGTGETNGGGGSVTYDGRGVFKSTDGGNSWTSLGLENTGSIGRIEVDPEHPDRIFVAAMGSLFSNNAERGLYRSTDGGQSWEKKLFVNDSTGIIDLAIHPNDPDTIFAVSWERIRRPSMRRYGGPGCGIWRSADGGDTWTKLSGGLPSGNNVGRIGIAISASEPNILYATTANATGFFSGTYKSVNGGDTWSVLSAGSNPDYSSFGWWFGQIRVDPTDAGHVYNLGVDWVKSTNGGANWTDVSPYLHADYHALYIHPANPDLMVAGNDGGIYISDNGGITLEHRPFPVTQFYTSEIDFQNPANFYGGAQDNGTWRTLTGNTGDWEMIYGGDGFVTRVHPDDNSLWYAEFQYGNFYGTNGAEAPQSLRYNWNTPYEFDPNDPAVMYFGAEKLFRSTDGGLSWTPVSSDLSNGVAGQGGVVYGTITTIAVSPPDAGTLIAGTDDGNVWFTSNGGSNWTKVSAALPKRWITRVVADLWDKNTAYVCLSGFRHFDDMAHIYKTTDKGQTWTNVSGDLPDMPVNDLVLDPADPNIWYVATDAGVMVTYNGGADWEPLGINLPNVPILDLTLHAPTRTLAAATYGRSMYKAVLPLPTSTVSPAAVKDVVVFPNPFKNRTTLSFSVLEKQNVNLEVFALSGKLVKAIFSGEIPRGEQRFEITGEGWGAGVYLVKMEGKGGRGFCQKLVKVE
ncbi:MAG: hypothetical protein EPGJADBJ_03269 [Saprospiraceae bacterium]|nr:hypothetical protein [Saprospiraceae bacterium]